VVAPLVKLLDDPEDIVRSAAYNALIMLGKSAAGSKAGQGS
jgi:HEAT repeat protein